MKKRHSAMPPPKRHKHRPCLGLLPCDFFLGCRLLGCGLALGLQPHTFGFLPRGPEFGGFLSFGLLAFRRQTLRLAFFGGLAGSFFFGGFFQCCGLLGSGPAFVQQTLALGTRGFLFGGRLLCLGFFFRLALQTVELGLFEGALSFVCGGLLGLGISCFARCAWTGLGAGGTGRGGQ